MTGSSQSSEESAGGWRCSKPQGLWWLDGDVSQRQVDMRVSNAQESSMQGLQRLQCRFWIRSKLAKLCAKVLESEQGFGFGCASTAWATPCQAFKSLGTEHQEISKSIFELKKLQQSSYRLNMRMRAWGGESGSAGEPCTVRCNYRWQRWVSWMSGAGDQKAKQKG